INTKGKTMVAISHTVEFDAINPALPFKTDRCACVQNILPWNLGAAEPHDDFIAESFQFWKGAITNCYQWTTLYNRIFFEFAIGPWYGTTANRHLGVQSFPPATRGSGNFARIRS